eukprot:169874-Alexandrium_andersonii.AAC.1
MSFVSTLEATSPWQVRVLLRDPFKGRVRDIPVPAEMTAAQFASTLRAQCQFAPILRYARVDD